MSETAQIANPISGDKLYQQRARTALPLLVRQAEVQRSIYYSDLAEELEMPNPRNLNYVLGSIGQSLIDLSKQWRENIPAIQCVVINKQTELPGEGIGWFFNNGESSPAHFLGSVVGDIDSFRKLSRNRQKALVNEELQRVYLYPKWMQVLKELRLEPVKPDYEALLRSAASGRGGEETEEHRLLKGYVAAHPEILGLPVSAGRGQVEYPLPSRDCLDVFFRHAQEAVCAEVKSAISDEADIVRGIFQCVKYSALLEAEQATKGDQRKARAVLVLESRLPARLIPMKNILGIEVIEGVKPMA